MGEAKRRKKILKEAYGEKPAKLNPGSNLFHTHLEKFWDAIEEELTKITGSAGFSEEEEIKKIQQEKLDKWLKNYFDNYTKVDREKLAMEVMNPLYEKLWSATKSQVLDPVWAHKWSSQALSFYRIFKPFLSAESAKIYAKPLQAFYDTVITESLEKAREEGAETSKFEKFQQKFEEVLEIEESRCY